MPRFPKKVPDGTNKIADNDDKIPAYCIVEQRSNLNTVPIKNRDEVRPILTTKDGMDTPANDRLCQNLKKLLKKDVTIIVKNIGLLRRKVPADGTIQILVSKRYRRTAYHRRHCETFAGQPGTKIMYGVLR